MWWFVCSLFLPPPTICFALHHCSLLLVARHDPGSDGDQAISTQAKPRLLKFYNLQAPEKHQDLVRSVFQLLSARPDSVSNFVKVDSVFGPGTKMVYKHLATLYFVFVFDSSENELAMLDLIQVFVETLDRCFMNVCELDIVFNFNKLHTILDEMILGGQVIETSSEQIVKSVEEIERLEKQSSTTSFIPKSITERFTR